tara:strand:+ start:82 stop:759 length:678 start_codon:yes stop_codon:yes gene_type:complete
MATPFKMRSGNKVSFKSMGSSPAKQAAPTAAELAQIETNKQEPRTNQEIKQTSKTQKDKNKRQGSDGGKKRTFTEKNANKIAKRTAQLERAKILESQTNPDGTSKGERTFGWKNFGKGLLEGKGIMPSLSGAIGTGEYKSSQAQRRLDKLKGNKNRYDEGVTQDTDSNTKKATQEVKNNKQKVEKKDNEKKDKNKAKAILKQGEEDAKIELSKKMNKAADLDSDI